MLKKYLHILIILAGIIILVFSSCRKDEDFITDSSYTLTFSADTILFDTVFTTIGSTTARLKVYNNENEPVKISNIKLAGGTSSNYRINVDGMNGTQFSDVEIGANDSLFVFVRVTVDPTSVSSPLVISDSIVFMTNGNVQDIQLVAWGQDAYYHTPTDTLFFSNGILTYGYASCAQPWPNDKPHLIYGYCVVDTDSTLVIQEGTKVHMHNNAILWVYEGGSLQVNGTLSDPVVFEGDRLESYYEDVPGQWGKIWLSAGSKDNAIDHAIIRNGSIGLQADTMVSPTYPNPTLRVSNTVVENMSAAAIYGLGTTIEAENCVFANCGQYVAVLSIGGRYNFKHCTFANYWSYAVRQTASVVLNNYYEDVYGVFQVRDLEEATFENCIIYGNIAEELLLDSFPNAGQFNYLLDHCLIKTENAFNSNFNTCLRNVDPLFVDYSMYDYRLGNGSPAIDAGNPSVLVPIDLDGNARDATPDMGAYEWGF